MIQNLNVHVQPLRLPPQSQINQHISMNSLKTTQSTKYIKGSAAPSSTSMKSYQNRNISAFFHNLPSHLTQPYLKTRNNESETGSARKSSCLIAKQTGRKTRASKKGNDRETKLVVIDGLRYPGESVIKSRKLFSKYVNTVMNDSGTNSPELWVEQQVNQSKPRNAQIDTFYSRKRTKTKQRHHFTIKQTSHIDELGGATIDHRIG